MPIVILKLSGVSGDYDPPATLCYVDLTPAHAAELCRSIEAVHALAESGVPRDVFSQTYAVEVFGNPARACEIPDSQHDQLGDAETGEPFGEWYGCAETEHDEEGKSPYFVVDGDDELVELLAEWSVRSGTDTMLIKPDSIYFTFPCKHSAGVGESECISYWQLAAWAGELTLPNIVRATSLDGLAKDYPITTKGQA